MFAWIFCMSWVADFVDVKRNLRHLVSGILLLLLDGPCSRSYLLLLLVLLLLLFLFFISFLCSV